MTAALEVGEWSAAHPSPTLPRERHGTLCTGGWVGPRSGQDGRKISPNRDLIPGRPVRSSVTIPTELPGPQQIIQFYQI